MLLSARCVACIPEPAADESSDDFAAVNVVSAAPQTLRAEELDALEDPAASEGDLLSVTISDGMPSDARVERRAAKTSKASMDELRAGKPRSATPTNVAAPAPKLSPAISAEPMVNVLIRYADRDTVRLPRLPRLNPDEPRDSANNSTVREKTERLIQHVQALRANDHARHGDAVRGGGGQVTSEYWLLNALSARVPHDQLQALADDPEVVSITSEEASEDAAGRYLATIADGRAMLNTDPYFNVPGINTGFLGLLDSGTRRTHFELMGRIDFWRDCVNGTSGHCTIAGPGLTLDPNDTFSFNGHGTSVANVMSGTGALNATFRGVTGITIDSFMIGHQRPDNPAVIRGLQAALAASDDVINCSFMCVGTEVEAGICDDAADSAFDSGAIVVAAMNDFDGPSVIHPGGGHKVLAVGAVDINRNRWASSSQGPASDGRTKPDLMALGVDVRVATNASDNLFANRNGTSIATPFVTGATALMRRWLKIAFPNNGIEAGNVMAMMIASGSNPSNPTSDFTIGAGIPTLPAGSTVTLVTTKAPVTNGTNQEFSIAIPSGRSSIKVALWWPENRSMSHNDIDLSLLTASGSTIATSLSSNSIWEKLRATVTGGTTVKIRARGFRVTGTQQVFIAAIIQ